MQARKMAGAAALVLFSLASAAAWAQDAPLSDSAGKLQVPTVIAQMQDISSAAGRKFRAADARYAERIKAVLAPDLLAPARLVTPEGIASGRAAVAQAGLALDRYQQEREQISNESNRAIEALSIDERERPAFLAAVRSGQQRALAEALRNAENQRAILSLYLQVFDLMASCQDKVHLQDGKLVFDNPDDAARLLVLADQFKHAALGPSRGQPAPASR